MNKCMVGALKGKVAVITGGGSGIGKAMVERFLAEGASCLAADINKASVDSLAEELSGEYAGKILTYEVNVADKGQVEAMIDYAVAKFGKMDVMINNAGIMDNLLPIAELPDEMWDRVLSVNLNSVMYACRGFLHQWRNPDHRRRLERVLRAAGNDRQKCLYVVKKRPWQTDTDKGVRHARLYAIV